MVNREHVLAVLRGRFRGASARQFAEAANAIVALPDEWEEVQAGSDGEVRLFRKREPAAIGRAAAGRLASPPGELAR